ncbi:MAG: ribonuclease HII [Bowdeniella nasicola]|nr:ribonuclease HII [Bowdeniella nasicola]
MECIAQLLGSYRYVIGLDEVGRGAIAGPVSVGAALVSTLQPAPSTLADSKLLTARQRRMLVPQLSDWLDRGAVGHVAAHRIDRDGLRTALQLAAWRALLRLLHPLGDPQVVARQCAIIIDGPTNWCLAPPALGSEPLSEAAAIIAANAHWRTEVKADTTCMVVAAASVLAKTTRDAYMASLPDPGYGYRSHKGYGSPAHLAALRTLGASHQHRQSWKSVRQAR